MDEPLPDHYRVLGVSPLADFATIHAAYRVLARRHHPDVTGDDGAMRALNAAWDTLRDPARRSAYDRERRGGRSLDHAGPPPGGAFGPVMTYGQYEDWSLGEIARFDPAYLEWLRKTPAGWRLRADIDAVFAELAERPLTLGGRRPAFAFGGRAAEGAR